MRLSRLTLAVGCLALAAACGGSSPESKNVAPAPTARVTTAATTTVAPVTTVVATTLPPTTLPATTLPPTTVAETTTVPITAPPETIVAELPTPAPPPEAYAPEERVEIGRIAIPKIGVDKPMLEGITLTTLDQGPGHWPGTASPGQIGNVVIAGHRMSHDKPFENLDQLVPGDEVFLDDAGGRHRYLVSSTEIVNPDAMWIVNQTPDRTATLFACHPKGSTKQRIVVHLAFAETSPL